MSKEKQYIIRARSEDGTFYLGHTGDFMKNRAYAKRFSAIDAAAFVCANPPQGEANSGVYYYAIPED